MAKGCVITSGKQYFLENTDDWKWASQDQTAGHTIVTRKIIANAKLETLVDEKGHGKIVEIEKRDTHLDNSART